MHTKLFKDRSDAGAQLAERLLKYKKEQPLILALPRGGVEVAAVVAQKLHAPLDVVVARKLGAPFNPEFGIGAIATGNTLVLDSESVASLGISQQELQEIIDRETAEMERRIDLYRGNRHAPNVADKTVILVDDGLATGVTAKAAIASIRLGNPRKLILAIPVAAADTSGQIREQVDDLVCLHKPKHFMAVGLWYEKFEQLSDQDVINYLRKSKP